jgi:FkbH-like protein
MTNGTAKSSFSRRPTSPTNAPKVPSPLEQARRDSSFPTWQKAVLSLRRHRPAPLLGRGLRIALLGSYTTHHFGRFLEVAGAVFGFKIELYTCPYGQFEREILDRSSGLYAFNPEVVILAVHEKDVALPPLAENPEEAVKIEAHRWTRLWSQLQERTTATIVQHNFAVPPDQVYGSLGARLPGSRRRLLRRLNDRLGEEAGSRVGIVDCEALAGRFGFERWFDDRYWHSSKQAVSLDALPTLARETAAVIVGLQGWSRRCLVLDLDNTLWGGVIGEDGLSGIELGGSPEGEAFADFQRYLKAMKDRGIVLAVSSKNNPEDVEAVFERHPEMLLKRDDFAVIQANWRSKAENLREISERLSLSLSSLAFVDDNPAECELVRQQLPEVAVICVDGDPTTHLRRVAQSGLFETGWLTEDDRRRAESYRARGLSESLKAESHSLEDYLASLEMEATIEPFDPVQRPRLTQLFHKTNQFNLTALRLSEEEVAAAMEDSGRLGLMARLRDRFADHGLVALILGTQDGETVRIDNFLMSCRVIGRTLEDAIFATFAHRAFARGARHLRATFHPTGRNELVRKLYPRLGFKPVYPAAETASAETPTDWQFSLETADDLPPFPAFIQTPANHVTDHAERT